MRIDSPEFRHQFQKHLASPFDVVVAVVADDELVTKYFVDSEKHFLFATEVFADSARESTTSSSHRACEWNRATSVGSFRHNYCTFVVFVVVGECSLVE